MSSYLLLRNNKESGPYTMEEVKGLSLNAYDLLWVVGKSAAWRYPGEISELKSFAPAVPEFSPDHLFKKQGLENHAAETAISKKSELTNTFESKAGRKSEPANSQESAVSKNLEPVKSRDNHSMRVAGARAVYVNLPAEKKHIVIQPDRVLFEADPPILIPREPDYDFSDLYKNRPSGRTRFPTRILWISTIALLFGAGLLTGFFISDRRNFFSNGANHAQNRSTLQPAVLNDKKEIFHSLKPVSQNERTNESVLVKADAVKGPRPVSKRLTSTAGKKNLNNLGVKRDSALSQTASLSSNILRDSLRQNTISRSEQVYQKIKAHPENYISLEAGRYSTGMFGGISSFPVTVTNNSKLMMDLVVVNIDYIQNNEKIFKTESLSFNDLEPGESVTLKAPKSPRGIKIACHIHIVNPRQPDPGNPD
jgi:hypothetical protein